MMDESSERRLADKAGLSTDRSGSARTDEDIVGAVERLIGALGRRLADGDPDGAQLLRHLSAVLDEAFDEAVTGWRRHGFTDTQIGRELGVSKQAVQQRFPRGRASDG